jgi:hypothetical protein
MPFSSRLDNFSHWLTGNQEEAEDLVPESYAKTLKGFSSFQPGTGCRAWIYRIPSNTISHSAPVESEASRSRKMPTLGSNHRRIGEW